MEEYPDIIANPIIFKVTILVPEVPKIPDFEFTIGESIVQFVYDPFFVRPRDFDVGENSVIAYVFTGSSLPQKIDITSANFREVTNYNWINVNYELNKIAIFATGSAAVGEYTVVIA